MSSRWNNYGLWVAVFALIGMAARDFFGVEIEQEHYQTYVDAIMTILIFAGIVNNPSMGKGYKDK